MAWYRTGTVTVTNGSTAVTGAGTAFVEAVLAGDAFVGPDGRTYEIAAVVSATQITLAIGYMGSTQAGAAYAIQPTQGRVIEQNALLEALLTAYQTVYNGPGQGKFADGTPAAPGMRFTSDADTGFTRPAANQIGFAAGGAVRALLSTTALSLNVPLTGTAVQTDSVDGASGKILRITGNQGSFGLGGQGILMSNFATPPGFSHFIAGSSTGSVEPPPDNGAFRPGIAAYRDSSARLSILMFTTNGLVMRNYTGGVAEMAWNTVFTQRTILGTVSQAAGIPTGAVIESGNNANGRYVRWADGTQICTKDNTAITTAPAAFVGTITKIDGDKLWIGRWF